MKIKEKLILSAALITIGSIFNLFFTAALHGLLSRQYDTLTLVPLFQCLSGLFAQRQQLFMFLAFEGFICLCCVLFWVQNDRPYQSDLIKVAGDICTPAPVGQFQHGSSRWLKEDEKGKVFRTQDIDPANPIIKMLLDTGYDDLPFMKKGIDYGETGQEDTAQDKADVLPSVSIKKKELKEDENFETVSYDVAASDLRQVDTEHEQDKEEKTVKASKEREEEPPDPNKLFDSGGIVVGMEKHGNREILYCIGDDTHTLTIGATRSGKTRCLVVQSICSLALAGESLVISDPKAELYDYTAGYLKKLGYEIICLDFKNPEKSTRYNLLQPVIDAVREKDMERAEMYAWDITNILVGDNTSNEKIWENGEKSTIAAAILCVVVDNAKRPQYQNLTNVYWFIAEMSKAVGGKSPMSEYMKKLDSNHPARALMSIAEVAPSRTKGSFDTSALTTLRLFTSRSVYSITHKSDYNIADIGRKKQALFLILPDEKTTYYPIASLMVSQLYELLVRQSDMRGGRLIRRVNFVLDEFGNFTKLNDFTNKLTVAGGRGVRFNLFLQSFEQEAPRIARACQPGEFVIVKMDEAGERIPLTICDYDREKGLITIVFQIVGASTERMAGLKAGDSFADFVGPLGQPSEFVKDDLEEVKKRRYLFVAGGVGSAPVYPQVKWLKERGIDVDVVEGAKTKDMLILEEEMRSVAGNLYITTDDGSYVRKGMVTDVVKDLVENQGKKYDVCVAIGPMIMMKFVCRLTKELGIPTIVSMNPIMVDGTGMCGACRVSVGGEVKFACVDGPEFDGHLVDFDQAMKRQQMYKTEEGRAILRLREVAAHHGALHR